MKIPGLDVELSPEQASKTPDSPLEEGEENEAYLRAKLLASLQRRKELAAQKAVAEATEAEANEKESKQQVLESAPTSQWNSPSSVTTSTMTPLASPAKTLSPKPLKQESVPPKRTNSGINLSLLSEDHIKSEGRKSPTSVDLVPVSCCIVFLTNFSKMLCSASIPCSCDD